MSRKFIFILFLFQILSMKSHAQTLHFMVFGDTEDSRIGIPTAISCGYLKGLSEDIARNAELKENYQQFLGKSFTKAQMQNTINNLTISSKDVVFLYIISHGWNNMQNEFPMIVFGPKTMTIDESSINLSEIHQKLEAKKPRLLIVFGEACNRERETRAKTNKSTANHPPRVDVNPEQFRNLFRRSTKSVILCSSKRGQVSTSDMDGGGWFTQSFRDSFEEMTSVKYQGEANWDALLTNTKKATERLAYESGSDDPQSPFYEIKDVKVFATDVPNQSTLAQNPNKKPTPSTNAPKTETKPLLTKTEEPAKTESNTEICKYNKIAYQVNREKVQYLERYWQGLEEISNDEAAERFTEFYSKDTKGFYENLTQRLGLGNLQTEDAWLRKKGKEVIEMLDEANEYVETSGFKMKLISKLPLAIEPMKEITQHLDDIRRRCSE